jgi:hypothetical protein
VCVSELHGGPGGVAGRIGAVRGEPGVVGFADEDDVSCQVVGGGEDGGN